MFLLNICTNFRLIKLNGSYHINNPYIIFKKSTRITLTLSIFFFKYQLYKMNFKLFIYVLEWERSVVVIIGLFVEKKWFWRVQLQSRSGYEMYLKYR